MSNERALEAQIIPIVISDRNEVLKLSLEDIEDERERAVKTFLKVVASEEAIYGFTFRKSGISVLTEILIRDSFLKDRESMERIGGLVEESHDMAFGGFVGVGSYVYVFTPFTFDELTGFFQKEIENSESEELELARVELIK